MEPNDTLLTATQTGIGADDIGEFRFDGTLSDNLNPAFQDVDLYALELSDSTSVFFDIVVGRIRTGTHGLRIFDSEGNQLASNDSDSGPRESFIGFSPTAPGTYYLGISGPSNLSYDPSIAEVGLIFRLMILTNWLSLRLIILALVALVVPSLLRYQSWAIWLFSGPLDRSRWQAVLYCRCW